jgi:CRP-like cAMP-binding protein
LLAGLSDAQRQELMALGRRRTFARNEVVCHAGDPADSLHLVLHGLLAVRVSLPSGDTSMINVLGGGGYFGELALLRSEATRTATITALEPTATLAVSATAFRRLREANPQVEHALSALLADRIDRLSQKVLELTYVGVDRRLYRRLDELCAGAPAGPVSIPLTQSQLGELTGGTRPTVNQALQRLVEQGIIALGRGRVDVLDRARLRARCGY